MPLTIGPFTNVPAPGDPIRSDWPQQLTQYVVDQFARLKTERFVPFHIGEANKAAGTHIIYVSPDLGAPAYTTRVTVWAGFNWGFAGDAARAQHAIRPNNTPAGERNSSEEQVDPTKWTMTPLVFAWDCGPGINRSFHLATTVHSTNAYVGAHGVYHQQRLD